MIFTTISVNYFDRTSIVKMPKYQARSSISPLLVFFTNKPPPAILVGEKHQQGVGRKYQERSAIHPMMAECMI